MVVSELQVTIVIVIIVVLATIYLVALWRSARNPTIDAMIAYLKWTTEFMQAWTKTTKPLLGLIDQPADERRAGVYGMPEKLQKMHREWLDTKPPHNQVEAHNLAARSQAAQIHAVLHFGANDGTVEFMRTWEDMLVIEQRRIASLERVQVSGVDK